MQQCSVTVFLWQELSKEEVGFSWSFSVVFVCFVSVSELLMGEVDSSTLLSVLPSEKSRVSVCQSLYRADVGSRFWLPVSGVLWLESLLCDAVVLHWNDSHEHTWLMCMTYMWHNVWWIFVFILSWLFSLWRTSRVMSLHTHGVIHLSWVHRFDKFRNPEKQVGMHW